MPRALIQRAEQARAHSNEYNRLVGFRRARGAGGESAGTRAVSRHVPWCLRRAAANLRAAPLRLRARVPPEYSIQALVQRLHTFLHSAPGREAVIVGSDDMSLMAGAIVGGVGCARACGILEERPYRLGYMGLEWLTVRPRRIPFLLRHRVLEIQGDRVSGVVVTALDESGTPAGKPFHISCDTVIFSGEFVPENVLARQANLVLDPHTQGPRVDQDFQTDVRGIFACGNLIHAADAADHALEDGERAAEGVMHFLNAENAKATSVRPIVASDGVNTVIPQCLRWYRFAPCPGPPRRARGSCHVGCAPARRVRTGCAGTRLRLCCQTAPQCVFDPGIDRRADTSRRAASHSSRRNSGATRVPPVALSGRVADRSSPASDPRTLTSPEKFRATRMAHSGRSIDLRRQRQTTSNLSTARLVEHARRTSQVTREGSQTCIVLSPQRTIHVGLRIKARRCGGGTGANP